MVIKANMFVYTGIRPQTLHLRRLLSSILIHASLDCFTATYPVQSAMLCTGCLQSEQNDSLATPSGTRSIMLHAIRTFPP